MTVLITGNLGYVGSVLTPHLRRTCGQRRLVGLDTGFYSGQHEGDGPSPEVDIDEVHYVDVRRVNVDHLRGVTAVVYLAAISNDPMGDRFAGVTDDVNRAQTLRIADLARVAGVRRFTFASSASVYGTGDSTARNESSELAPQTAYARSKVETEVGLRQLAADDFMVTCMRFSTACGWSPRVRLDLVLNDFVASAITTGRISVLSDGTPWRPLIHVRDMARAIEWTLSGEREDFAPFIVTNVGRDEWNFQVRDLAEAVAETLGDVSVEINKEAQADTRSYRVDFDQWRRLAPSHQPIETLDETIRELAQHLLTLRDLDSEFRGAYRIRLHRLQQLKDLGYLDDNLRWTARTAV